MISRERIGGTGLGVPGRCPPGLGKGWLVMMGRPGTQKRLRHHRTPRQATGRVSLLVQALFLDKAPRRAEAAPPSTSAKAMPRLLAIGEPFRPCQLDDLGKPGPGGLQLPFHKTNTAKAGLSR